ncbi:aminoglycoside phosphotransferase family protein [Dyella sp.]|uniref:aminoglycoside phosphotransferase family protein n=1 Tax=Dyella sp. TaxID=1869338 RepID=UPI002ED39D60
MHNDRATLRLAWARKVLDDASLELAPASADASFRSYWRAVTGPAHSSWIIMDSPPAQEDPRPWLDIGARLAAAGLHVPAVHAHDVEQGLLLIEDLGSHLYLPALNDETVEQLYGDAMDSLLRMQMHVDVAGMQTYDQAFLRRELDIMPEWFLGRHLGVTLTTAEREVLGQAFEVLLHSAQEQPLSFVHRDFHSRNLLIVDQGGNPGIIDFQGALIGPITYDLASLLRDCYITWDRERVEGWVENYRMRLREARLIDDTVDTDRFQRWFDLIGLQRHIKVLGLFCRLWYRDGKRGYLDDLPRVFAYVSRVARRYHELADVAALLERHVGTRDLRESQTT